MKKTLLFLSIFWTLISGVGCKQPKENLSALVLEKSAVIIQGKDFKFRDLNKNGKLDIYENPNQSIEERVGDLLVQMNLAEKAGMMFLNGVPVSSDGDPAGRLDLKGPASESPTVIASINESQMFNFNVWDISKDPAVFAKWYNKVQQYAEKDRLGIPITIASDPRHHFSNNIFTMSAQGFSQFCEPLGLAALRDEQLVKKFADIVRQEYLAIGIREALHPQLDLATEPRWSRISGGFGEDAALSAKMGKAYILGMQGENLNKEGIACMTKHFPGGGPQKEGLDPHFDFQKGQVYPGGNFNYHLIPFEAAFEAKTSAIMPYYGVPTDQTEENVAMAFNKMIVTKLLREKYKYDGVVCTDWGVITDEPMGDYVWKARSWGVEKLSEAEKVLKVIEAGCDQFGGESRPELIVQLVKEGKLKEERLNISVKRILKQKFQLGLFDNPFVDESKIAETLGKKDFKALGEQTQKESMTLLKNDQNTLPLLAKKWKVYVENMDSTTVAHYAQVVKKPSEADFAIIRLSTPWYPVKTENVIAQGFHHGDLDFKGKEKQHILNVLNTVPTIVDIYLDRPAVIPEIAAHAKALIANYGASDQSLCEVLFGNTAPKGKLPFELPASMEAVSKQKEDVPHDSKNPLYPFGFGLSYK